MVVSYRDHEIGVRHPARAAAGRPGQGRRVHHARARARSRSAPSSSWSRAPPSAADKVHEVTGGNPFFVAEVAKDPDRPLPASVRDAVLARTADLDDADLDVLQLVGGRTGSPRRPGPARPRRRPADPAPARGDRPSRPGARGTGVPARAGPPGGRDDGPVGGRHRAARPTPRRRWSEVGHGRARRAHPPRGGGARPRARVPLRPRSRRARPCGRPPTPRRRPSSRPHSTTSPATTRASAPS